MENMGDWEQKNLLHELAQGRELARQLQGHLNLPSSSHETREFLVTKILTSYEKALSMLQWSSSVGDQPQHTGGAGFRKSESPPSLAGSPRSEDSDPEHRDASRKRKAVPGWTQQVRVSPGVGLEGPLDDGYSWRKYGQKDILNAKYPRGYYRCTHRNVQGCLATKQVQRSDEDPTVFEITYRGRHTCAQGSHINPPPNASPEKQEQLINKNMDGQLQHHNNHQPPQNHQQPSQEMLLNFQTTLKVQTENLDTKMEQTFPSFHFASTSNTEKQVFQASIMDSNFVGSYSPSFVSPATSGANYFSVSPSGMSGFGGNQQHFQSCDSELTEIISAATSATNSPTVGFDFPFGQELDPNFTFDNPGFFS
ncbi:probable WRKY transcription factor 53 [Corylus avellana]|uniref:probable WRKY transcription factor 53 n=1 Tax=Corylus avellana TaxID=13451 RepID=UPI001E21D60C|nr:probable WRKY transcription factor 53 [Corylus avellana]